MKNIYKLFVFAAFAGMALVAPSCAGAGKPAQNDADVIVVGSGLAGSAAAYAALESGATVLMLEKNDKLGGTSLVSSGTYCAAGTELQKAKGIVDSLDLHYQDLNRIGRGKLDPVMARKAIAEAPGVWEWLLAHGLKASAASPYIDPVHSPYSVARTMTPAKNSANEFVKVFSQGMDQAYPGKLKVHLSTKALGLVKKGDRVVGVRVQEGGVERTYRAKAVVMATGGYGSNREMLKQYSPRYSEYRRVTPAWATGEGIEMAKAAGAGLVNMDYVDGYFGGVPSGPDAYDVGFGDLTSSFAERWTGEIWVGADGKRFVNEDDPDEDPRETAIDGLKDPRIFIVFDQGILEANGGKTPFRDFEAKLASGYAVKKADSLEGLAKAFGIDSKGLAESVDSVSAATAKDKADAFGKTTGMAFAKGPYYGILCYPTIFLTYGGIKVDASLRALSPEGKAIPGLYAAGEATGAALVSGHGMGGGTGVMPSIVFGLDAGRAAAAFSK